MNKADRIDYAELLRDAYRTIERLQLDMRRLEQVRAEPVAIVGMGCRVPGAAGVEAYWDLLRNGVDAIEEVPSNRWDVAQYYDPNPGAAGKMSTRWGGFLQDVDRFDAAFFGISPREANSMDPQQRLLLEVAWEALEHAGIAPDSLMGSQTGVFVGISTGDYLQLQTRHPDPSVYDTYLATGNSHSVASGRLAYALGLHGPTLSVDTACSSSLIALHLASRAIRDGSCPIALACGVNLIVAPETTATLSKAQMMSPTGRCRTFSADADGFVRSEGCGVVVLKRLSDAQSAGDRVLAVIRGSAINQDGRSNGLTAPNGLAQTAVIRAALADAGLEAADVSYVEAHGTGTPLGDPIEVQALADALCAQRPADNRLTIGSVKTNIGHLEAAAGICGLIKIVLALQHRQVPPHLHLKERNPHITWDAYPIDVLTRLTPWPARSGLPIAAVSSFGFSGSNAHVIVQAAPPAASGESPAEAAPRPVHVLTLSAKSAASLKRLADDFGDYLDRHPDVSLGDFCFTANTGRAHFPRRCAVTAATIPAAREQLARAAAATTVAASRDASRGAGGDLAFMFTGQGSQYAAMGRRLYDTQPDFRKAIDHCDALLQPLVDTSLLSMLFGADAQRLDQTALTQPALFAVEYALADLWRAWGVRPAFVLGHSVGELVAACVAGVFSLEDALRLVAARGRLMQALPPDGQMAVLMADPEHVGSLLADAGGEVSIAALNGPDNTVISGRADAVERVLRACERQDIRVQRLKVSHAFHSALLNPMLDPFEEVAAGLRYSPPKIRVISNLTGGPVHEEICHATYWRAHARQPVRFAEGMRALYEQGCRVFLEVGPSPVLIGMGRQVVPEADARWIPSLKHGSDDWTQMADGARDLYLAGQEIDWRAFDAPYRRQRIALPTYPFDRQRHWFKSTSVPSARTAATAAAPEPYGHPLLGRRVSSPLQEVQFESWVSASRPDYLAGHVIFGRTILPAAACVEAVLAAVRELAGDRPVGLEDVSYPEPLVFGDEETCRLQVLVKDGGEDRATFQVCSAPLSQEPAAASGWRLHARGTVCWTDERVAKEAAEIGRFVEVRGRCDRSIDVPGYYDRLAIAGFEYAHAFRALESLWGADGEALGLARLSGSEAAEAGSYVLHPALLDACLQVLGGAVQVPGDGTARSDTYLPTGFERVRVWKSGLSSAWSWARLRQDPERGSHVLVADIDLWTEEGELAARIDGVLLQPANVETLRGAAGRRGLHEWLYGERWDASEPGAALVPGRIRRWVLFGHGDEFTARLAERLRVNHADVLVVAATTADGAAVQGAVQVDPDSTDGFDRVLDATAGEPGASALGVVYLWRFGEGTEVDEVGRGVNICRGALHVVQSLLRRSADARLWFVTCGAQDVGGQASSVAFEQAPLLGFARAVALEHPTMGCVRVDLDPFVDSGSVEPLMSELRSGDREDEVAWRGGTRWVRRLERVNMPVVAERQSFSADGTYLVTGAFGGLGQVVARWLVSRGARHLILLSRRDHPEVSQSLLDELEQQGARAVVVCCNIGDYAHVRTVLDGIGRTMPPLRGLVHAAGTIDDGLVADLSWSSFERVLAPKVAGAWNLHKLTEGQPLDFLVLFSSAASLVGSPGQANYAAANAFLDALARHRGRLGRPGVSINWGPWSGAGMAAGVQQAHQRRWSEHGVGFIREEVGVEALDAVLRYRGPQIGVLPIDWREVHPGAEWMRRPLFANLHPHGIKSSIGESADPGWRDRLLALCGGDRNAAAVTYVRQAAARVLGLDDSALALGQPLTDFGFDSLMALDLRNQMVTELGITIPLGRLVSGATVDDCAEMACSLLEAAPHAAPDAARPRREELVL